jgi:hypothetical protein
MKKYFIGTFLLALLVLSISVFAQDNNTEPANCFDHYTFGSVYASLQTKNYNNVSGTNLNVFGEIKNDNSYPIVDGKLFAKVMRSNPDLEKNHGQDELDSFVIQEGISIPANSSIPVDFDWNIPAVALSGDYQIATYFLVDDKFNMSGLTFTNDIVGGTVKFKVFGEQTKAVFFDRKAITLNDNPYYTVTFNPSILPTEEGRISLTLTNDTNQTQRVPVTLELNKWDAQDSKNLLDKKETTYLIDANSSIIIPYTVTDTKHSVYYLVAKANYRDAKSEVAVRFSRQGVEEPRINFSTFQTYPFVKGEEDALITCVHNTNNNDAQYGKVVTSVLDHQGNVIHTSMYEGVISSAIQGMISKFTPKANYKDLTIETKIYDKEGAIVDESSVEYLCSDLSDDCKEPNPFLNFTTLIIALAVIVIILIFTFRNHLKKKDLMVMFVLPLLFLSFGMPQVGEAKEASWSVTESNSFFAPNWWNHKAIEGFEAGGGGGVAMNPNMSVSYFGTVDNLTTGQTNLSDNSIVKSRDKLRFKFGPSTNFWLLTGGQVDTPPGEWVPNAGQKVSCDMNSYYLTDMWGRGDDYESMQTTASFANFSVNPPIKSILDSNNLKCDPFVNVDDGNDQTDAGYIDCIVENVATSTIIQPKINFSDTYAKFYATMGSFYGCNPKDKDWVADYATNDFKKWGFSVYSDDQKNCYEIHTNDNTAMGGRMGIINVPLSMYGKYDLNPNTFTGGLSKNNFKEIKLYCWNDSINNMPMPRPFLETIYGGDGQVSLTLMQDFKNNFNDLVMKRILPSGTLAEDEFSQTIPAQTIDFTFTIQPNAACVGNTPPSVPTVEVSNSGLTSTITFSSTDAQGDAIMYQVDWGNGAGWITETSPKTKTWSGAGTSTIKVRAKDVCGISDPKSVTITITDPNVTPIAPTLNATEKCGSIEFSWNSVANATSYSIKRVSDSVVVEENITGTSYKLSITSEDKVKYVVHAVNGKEISVASNEVSAGSVCAECNFVYHNKEITSKPPNNLACTRGSLSGVITYNEKSKYWSWTCKIPDPNGHIEQCQSSPQGGSGPDDLKVKLKIQPKIAPNCVAQLVDNNGNTKPNILKGDEYCELTGPSGYTPSTYDKDNLLNKDVEKAGLYTLKCYATSTPGAIPKISTDVCISNPTTIER